MSLSIIVSEIEGVGALGATSDKVRIGARSLRVKIEKDYNDIKKDFCKVDQ